ncbi:MAG: hypothetical protein Q8O86_08140 [Dehalococcoidia bacterium]|nr:hypothetical protein [Dehalococcoidia bacterium]
MTKANLSAHLARLEEAGCIQMEKTFRGKVPTLAFAGRLENGRNSFPTFAGNRCNDSGQITFL